MPNNSAVGRGHIMLLRFGVSVQASGACTCHVDHTHRGGYTNGIYQVLSWTNFSRVEVPLHFRYSRFSPPGTNQPASGLILQMTYDGHASNVVVLKDVTPFVLPKQLPKFTRVSDYRFTPASTLPGFTSLRKGLC